MVDVRRLPVGEDNELRVSLDDLARESARRIIATPLEAEVADYVERFAEERDADGKQLVVRNGRARERRVTIGSGTMPVRAPRVNDRRVDEETGERQRFGSRILPAYARRSPKVNDVLPVLYLRGLSTGDFRPTLEQLLGEDAAGLSPSTISWLCKDWEAEHERFCTRSLGFHRYAYCFVDGVVRHEALLVRAGCETPPPVCRSGLVKLRAA
ncbi:MAG: transposase [Actinobacteria bacterium]|nr:transposase [Actinomycetota bacterium]